MTVQELNSRFNKIINDLQGDGLGRIMADIGVLARKSIYDRVKDTGVDAEGNKYTPYSTKEMLVGDKSFRAKDSKGFFRNKNLEWKSIPKPGVQKPTKGKHNKKTDYYRLAVLEGGYKKLREIAGRPTDHVDFFWSGQMWQGINIKSKGGEHNNGVVILGAVDEESRKKLEGNTKRKGDILKLSQSEIRELSQYFDNKIGAIVKKNGL